MGAGLCRDACNLLFSNHAKSRQHNPEAAPSSIQASSLRTYLEHRAVHVREADGTPEAWRHMCAQPQAPCDAGSPLPALCLSRTHAPSTLEHPAAMETIWGEWVEQKVAHNSDGTDAAPALSSEQHTTTLNSDLASGLSREQHTAAIEDHHTHTSHTYPRTTLTLLTPISVEQRAAHNNAQL
eukprot:476814-Rhodomonas_salina.1